MTTRVVFWGMRAGESDGRGLTTLGIQQVEEAASVALARERVRLTAIRRGAERDAWHAGRQTKRVLGQFNVEQVVADELGGPSCPSMSCEVCRQIIESTPRVGRPVTVAEWLHYDRHAPTRRTQALILLERLAEEQQQLQSPNVLLIESSYSHPVIELAVPDEYAGRFPRLAHGDMVRYDTTWSEEAGFKITEIAYIRSRLSSDRTAAASV